MSEISRFDSTLAVAFPNYHYFYSDSERDKALESVEIRVVSQRDDNSD